MKNIKNVVDEKQCTGCLLCKNVCPSNAITNVNDKEGFVIPCINADKCTECGKCVKYCPSLNNVDRYYPMETFAMQTDKINDFVCSSGGIATAISEKIVGGGGTAIGSTFNKNLEAVHAAIDSIQEVKLLAGSKYVQSSFFPVFEELDRIQPDRPAVIIGTPCQIAAVRCYMELRNDKNYSNILLADLICHGVPSNKFFQKYLSWLKNKKKADSITAYYFRNNHFAGYLSPYVISYSIEKNGKVKNKHYSSFKDPYMTSFGKCECYRECCYKCKYAVNDRTGDITLGDFAGILNYYPDMFDAVNKGCSAVMANTQKGLDFCEKNLYDFILTKAEYKQVRAGNRNLSMPSERPEIRNCIYDIADNQGFEYLEKRMYRSKSFYIAFIKMLLPSKLKYKIKKLIKRRL